MMIDVKTLIWLFPIAFMFHDFEELVLGEPWLRKYAGEIKDGIKGRIPELLGNQISAAMDKSASELALPISLIFGLTFLSSFIAIAYEKYGFFLIATGLFFLHGFMHAGQAILLRKYIPAVVSSVLVVIPYGFILYGRLLHDGIVNGMYWSAF